jgi:cell division septum initiation protein DivIVA
MAERRQRWVWWLLRPFAWLAARLATIAVTAALMGSLFVVSLAFETTTKALSWAAEAVTGRSFVASVVAENTNLKKRNRQLVQDVGELKGRNADLTRKNGELADDNRRLADEAEDLRGRNQRLSRDNERLKTANHALDEDVARLRATNAELGTMNRRLATQAEETVDMIDRRSAAVGQRMLRTSTRNVASIPLESVPVIGGVTIALVTALEISDACAMTNEIQELREFAGLSREDSLMSDVCSLVPKFPVEARYENAKKCRKHRDELQAEYGETSPEVASVVGAICTCLEDVGIPDKDSCYPEEIATVPSP